MYVCFKLATVCILAINLKGYIIELFYDRLITFLMELAIISQRS